MAGGAGAIAGWENGGTSTPKTNGGRGGGAARREGTPAETASSPTTMTSAGMVSGSRQRNSTSRVAAGTCSLTQIIVGTSRTTIPTMVMAASSRDVRIASLISGLSNSARQAAPVRSLVI